jgi:hypothetical protein
MEKKYRLLILIVLIGETIQEKSKWKIVSDSSNYFSTIKKEKIAVVIFFNLKECGCGERLMSNLKILENFEVVKKNEIDLNMVDYGDNEILKKYYNFTNQSYFYLFIKGRMLELFEFEELLDEENGIEKIKEFLMEKVNFVKEVKNMEEIEELLEKKGRVFVYLGEKNENFEIFHDFSQSFVEEEFYFSSEKNLKKKIFEKYSNEDSEGDVIVYLKDKKFLSEVDNETLDYLTVFEFKNLKNFYLMQKIPRIQSCAETNNLLKNLIHDNMKVVLYFTEGIENPEVNKIFENSVRNSPKSFIFAKCKVNDVHFGDLVNFVFKNNYQIKQNSLSIIHFTSGFIHLEHLTEAFSEANVSDFLKNFYLKNKNLFHSSIMEFENKLKNKEL